LFCISTVCDNPAPSNGVADAPSGFVYDKLAIISCDTGYSLSGDTLILCQANGTWTDYPTCEINGKMLESLKWNDNCHNILLIEVIFWYFDSQ
jgi:hypothetical protein